MSKEAMKLALETLKKSDGFLYNWHNPSSDDDADAYSTARQLNELAITALREALAEQPAQQTPVAWIEHEWSGTGLKHLHFERPEPTVRDEVVSPVWTPLYTSPPAQRKPLTDYEIANILPDDDTPMSLGEAFVKFARAIEAAHGIKGDA